MSAELFELELLGGATGAALSTHAPRGRDHALGNARFVTGSERLTARKSWTGAAYQEHRTGAACALTLQALIEARAPLDLIAVASRFPLDEMVHVELCARMAMEFGGGTEIIHDPKEMLVGCDVSLSPLLQAADLVVRFFCVGEALSIPLLRATWHVAKHPLPKAVLGRIVKDEAAHGVFGYTFLDWACPRFSAADKARLGVSADVAIRFLYSQWIDLYAHRDEPRPEEDVLGWMQTGAYLTLASHSMQTLVIDPLEARGIPIQAQLSEFTLPDEAAE